MYPLSTWNTRGLIFGPEETEENFYQRCLLASSYDSPVSLAKNLFDISPDWVEIVYSNKGLHFWEGGCTWIDVDKATIQLPKSFEHKKKILGIYTKDELLAHELVHAVRRTFDEPIFEEILAYQTSSSKFRRFFGPIFRSSKETRTSIFIFLSLLILLLYTPFALIPFFSFFSFGILRLIRAKRIFSKTRQKLAKLTDEQKALFILLRLKDREIIRFSKMDLSEIFAYMERMTKIDLRWQQIAIYFSK